MKAIFEPAGVSAVTDTPYSYTFAAVQESMNPNDVRYIPCGALIFQHDVHPDREVNGITMEVVIEALIDRLEAYQIDAMQRAYPCKEINIKYNRLALDHLHAAHDAMVDREAKFADCLAFRADVMEAHPEYTETPPEEETPDA